MAAYYFLRWFVLIIIGLLIYGQTFHFGFVFDDYLFIVTNPFIKNFSNFHLIWQAFPMTRFVGMYSFALNYHFNQLNPQGYHVVNFIIHLTATGVVWALAGLLMRITQQLPAKNQLNEHLPFIVAVIFLVHPCQTQAVTYITQRFESLATVFYLGAVYFYLSARVSTEKKKQELLFSTAGLLMFLGIMTKEVIITLPLMILAAEWVLFPKKDNKKLYFVLLLIGGALGLFLVKMLHSGASILLSSYPSESHDGETLTPVHYVLTQMRVFLTFLRLFIFPIHQNLDYDYPASTGLFHPLLTSVGACVIGGIIILIKEIRLKFPLIAFGLAWILITFSINLVPRSNVIFEHKLYLISFGFCLAFVSALSLWIKDRGAWLKVLCCVAAVLAVLSFQRNKVWANELMLWQDSVKNSPDKARVNASLGRVYGSLGRYEESVYYLTRALTIRADNITYENRGVIYSQMGRNDQALEDLNRSIALDTHYFPTYVKRAWVYQKLHRYNEALADLGHAIQLNPYYTDAFIERGLLLVETGQVPDALKDFQQALIIDPFNADAARYRSYCLMHMGQGARP